MKTGVQACGAHPNAIPDSLFLFGPPNIRNNRGDLLSPCRPYLCVAHSGVLSYLKRPFQDIHFLIQAPKGLLVRLLRGGLAVGLDLRVVNTSVTNDRNAPASTPRCRYARFFQKPMAIMQYERGEMPESGPLPPIYAYICFITYTKVPSTPLLSLPQQPSSAIQMMHQSLRHQPKRRDQREDGYLDNHLILEGVRKFIP